MPESCPMVLCTQKWLDWKVAIPVAPLPPPPAGMGPGWRSIQQWQALKHFGNPLSPDPTVPVLLNLTVFEICFEGTSWARFFGAYYASNMVFHSQIADEFECEKT